MGKVFVILLLIIIVLISLIGIIAGLKLTGNTIKNISKNYTYTKAICNSSNFCQDNIIECCREEVIKIEPITGAVVQHLKDWKDPRDNKTNLCEI